MKIAIDGTAGSGKGTLSYNLSKTLKLPRLDTGLLYRKVAFSYIKYFKFMPTQKTIDSSILKIVLEDFDLNDLDSEILKLDLYGNYASIIGKLDFVRNKLELKFYLMQILNFMQMLQLKLEQKEDLKNFTQLTNQQNLKIFYLIQRKEISVIN